MGKGRRSVPLVPAVSSGFVEFKVEPISSGFELKILSKTLFLRKSAEKRWAADAKRPPPFPWKFRNGNRRFLFYFFPPPRFDVNVSL